MAVVSAVVGLLGEKLTPECDLQSAGKGRRSQLEPGITFHRELDGEGETEQERRLYIKATREKLTWGDSVRHYASEE